MVDEQSEKWQVFAEVNYQGAKVLLEPGRTYTSLNAMGLGSAVKSLKKFDSNLKTDELKQRQRRRQRERHLKI